LGVEKVEEAEAEAEERKKEKKKEKGIHLTPALRILMSTKRKYPFEITGSKFCFQNSSAIFVE